MGCLCPTKRTPGLNEIKAGKFIDYKADSTSVMCGEVSRNIDRIPCLVNSVTNLRTLLNTFEPVHEKTNNLGLRPGLTQTRLYSHRSGLEA